MIATPPSLIALIRYESALLRDAALRGRRRLILPPMLRVERCCDVMAAIAAGMSADMRYARYC